MRKIPFPHTPICVLLVLLPFAAPVQAASSQTFVSKSGSDTNACTIAAPCLTFARAVAVTSVGGEIDALTPGNFGPVAITTSVTIDGKGMGSISTDFSSDSPLTVNLPAGSAVAVRNLSMNGTNGTSVGVDLLGSGSLLIDGCSFSGFINVAVFDEAAAAANLVVRNSTLEGGFGGLEVEASTNVTLDHVSITGFSTTGVGIYGSSPAVTITDSVITGGSTGVLIDTTAGASTVAMIERTTVSGASGVGVSTGKGVTNLDNSTFFTNNVGIEAKTSALIHISNNNFYDNHTAISCDGGAGTVLSAGNNQRGSNSGGPPSCSTIGTFTLQ